MSEAKRSVSDEEKTWCENCMLGLPCDEHKLVRCFSCGNVLTERLLYVSGSPICLKCFDDVYPKESD